MFMTFSNISEKSTLASSVMTLVNTFDITDDLEAIAETMKPFLDIITDTDEVTSLSRKSE